MTPANAMMTPTIAMIGLTGSFCLLRPFILLIIRANAAIIIDIAPADEIRLFVSMKDSATIEAAITPMATAIIMIAPLTFCAPLRLLTIMVIIVLSKPTAIIPLAKLAISMKLNRTATPARIAMDADIARIVPATLAILSLSPILSIDVSVFNNTTKPATNTAPFSISSTDSKLTNLQTPTNSNREKDTLRTKPLILANCCSFPILVTLTRAAMNNTNAPAKAAPFSISSIDSKPISLQTPTIRAIAIEIFNTKPPTLLTLLPALLATLVIAITKIANPAAKAAPFSISLPDKPLTSFITPTISSMAMESFIIIPPIPLISLLYLDIPPMAAKNAIMPTAISARPINPCLAFSGSRLPIILTAYATASIAKPICNSDFWKPLALNVLDLASKSTDALLSLSIATAKPISIRANAVITPTAFQSFPISSICVKIQMAATSTPIAIAILSRALALRSHEIPLRTLLKLLSTFPALKIRSSMPPSAFASPLNEVTSCFSTNIIDTIAPPAKSFPHSILPFSSVIKSHNPLKTLMISSPIRLRTFNTGSNIDLAPLIAPWKKSLTISYAFQEGEWTPRASAKLDTNSRQKFMIFLITPPMLSLIPF